MADKKDDAKSLKKNKKSVSMRESAAKTREKQAKPKRVRRAAQAAGKPVGKIGNALTAEYHVIPQKNGGNFFTKSRRFIPRYIRESVRELKTVTWPGRKETWRLVFAVFVFAITLGVTIALVDYGLENLFRKVIL
jgi:preprotein translocase SecE subunit